MLAAAQASAWPRHLYRLRLTVWCFLFSWSLWNRNMHAKKQSVLLYLPLIREFASSHVCFGNGSVYCLWGSILMTWAACRWDVYKRHKCDDIYACLSWHGCTGTVWACIYSSHIIISCEYLCNWNCHESEIWRRFLFFFWHVHKLIWFWFDSSLIVVGALYFGSDKAWTFTECGRFSPVKNRIKIALMRMNKKIYSDRWKVLLLAF